VLTTEALFYTCIIPFIIFFGAFAFVIYPAREAIHPTEFCEKLLANAGERFAGPIAILRNWSYCLFYVMAELWGSVVVSVLFWGFANQITTVDEASQFYPLFGCAPRARRRARPRGLLRACPMRLPCPRRRLTCCATPPLRPLHSPPIPPPPPPFPRAAWVPTWRSSSRAAP
jgi:hypothetical protein